MGALRHKPEHRCDTNGRSSTNPKLKLRCQSRGISSLNEHNRMVFLREPADSGAISARRMQTPRNRARRLQRCQQFHKQCQQRLPEQQHLSCPAVACKCSRHLDADCSEPGLLQIDGSSSACPELCTRGHS